MSHLATNHSYFKHIYNKELAAPRCKEEICFFCLETKLLKPFFFLEWFLTFQAAFKVLTQLHLCFLMGKDDIEKIVFYFCMFSSILSFPPNRHAISRIIFPAPFFPSIDTCFCADQPSESGQTCSSLGSFSPSLHKYFTHQSLLSELWYCPKHCFPFSIAIPHFSFPEQPIC